MAKEITKVKKIFCDFCEKEIRASSSVVMGKTELKGITVGVEIRMVTPNKRRFANDICHACICDAVLCAIDPRSQVELPQPDVVDTAALAGA